MKRAGLSVPFCECMYLLDFPLVYKLTYIVLQWLLDPGAVTLKQPQSYGWHGWLWVMLGCAIAENIPRGLFYRGFPWLVGLEQLDVTYIQLL